MPRIMRIYADIDMIDWCHVKQILTDPDWNRGSRRADPRFQSGSAYRENH